MLFDTLRLSSFEKSDNYDLKALNKLVTEIIHHETQITRRMKNLYFYKLGASYS